MASADTKRPLRVGASNFISQLFFLWLFRFIWKIRRCKEVKRLNLELRNTEASNYNDEALEKYWKKEKELAASNKRLPVIRKAIFKAYGLTFVLNGIWKIVWGISLWFGAYWLLKQTVAFVRAQKEDTQTGQLYALGFLLSSIVASIAIHQMLSQSGRLGLRVCFLILINFNLINCNREFF